MTPKQRKEAAMLKQQAIVNAAKADGNRALTAEEQAQFNSLQREIDEAQAEIDAQERGLAGGTGATAAPHKRELNEKLHEMNNIVYFNSKTL